MNRTINGTIYFFTFLIQKPGYILGNLCSYEHRLFKFIPGSTFWTTYEQKRDTLRCRQRILNFLYAFERSRYARSNAFGIFEF